MTLPGAFGIIAAPFGRLALIAFILRRLLQSIVVMAVGAFIAFGLFNFAVDPRRIERHGLATA